MIQNIFIVEFSPEHVSSQSVWDIMSESLLEDTVCKIVN